ncbi:MAG: hypothetical protein GC159_20420 [Phycisphaera sp.]|nr:hypothetical protein [Phycisphaera sp.]
MSMSTSKARIMHAFKELTVAWAETKEQWNDSASARFQERFLDPIETRVRSTVGAMELMEEVFSKVKRDCGPE